MEVSVSTDVEIDVETGTEVDVTRDVYDGKHGLIFCAMSISEVKGQFEAYRSKGAGSENSGYCL